MPITHAGIMRAQAMGTQSADMLKYIGGRKILEINPRHPVVQHVKELLEKEGEDSTRAKQMAMVMYDTALLESGFEPKAAKAFAQRIYDLMSRALDVEASHGSEPVDIEIPEDDVEESEEVLGGVGAGEEELNFDEAAANVEGHDEL